MHAKIPSQLYIVHLALMLGPCMFAGMIYFVLIPQAPEAGVSKEQTMVFQTVAAVLAVLAVGMSQLVPRFLFRGEKSVPLQKYTAMKIVQWALIEGAALFLTVVFFMTHEKSMLIPFAILIALMALLRPTVDEIVRHNVVG